jgi:DNA polymerase-1
MFYGMPARIVNAAGKPIQGTLGFVGALLKILRMVQPSHAAVVFDGECANPRREMDPDYKANREDLSVLPEEDTPFSQLPDIFAALDYLRIPYKETTDCEADDWMARFAWQFGGSREVVIASQDSDLFQLINQNVRILRYRGDKTVICDETYIMEKLGVTTGQYAAFKALTGDSSDNIPGIPKIGPMTAAALINRFGSLKAILDGAERIEKPSIRTSIQQHRQRALQNYRLVRLDGEGALPFSMEEMIWQDRGVTTGQVLQAIGVK